MKTKQLDFWTWYSAKIENAMWRTAEALIIITLLSLGASAFVVGVTVPIMYGVPLAGGVIFAVAMWIMSLTILAYLYHFVRRTTFR